VTVACQKSPSSLDGIGGVVDSPARRNKQAADERQRLAEDAIRNDPEVQMLMREFDAKIVPGTLKPA